MTIQEGKEGIINYLKDAGYNFEVTEDSDKKVVVTRCIRFKEDQEPIDVRYIVYENLLISVAYYGDLVTDDNVVELLKAISYCNSRWTYSSHFEMDLEEKRIRSVYRIHRDGEGWIPPAGRDRFFIDPARTINLLHSLNEIFWGWMRKPEFNTANRTGIIEKWRSLC